MVTELLCAPEVTFRNLSYRWGAFGEDRVPHLRKIPGGEVMCGYRGEPLSIDAKIRRGGRRRTCCLICQDYAKAIGWSHSPRIDTKYPYGS